MTEYKKLVALVDKLEEDVATLYQQWRVSPNSVDEEGTAPLAIDALFAVAEGVRAVVLSTAPRVKTIAAKAREKDPNRQIYNEAMCGRIEELVCRFSEAVGRLLYGIHNAARSSGDEGRSPQSEEDSIRAITAMVLESVELPLEESAVLAEIEARYNADLLRRAEANAWAGRVAGDIVQHIQFEEQSRQVLVAEERLTRAALSEEKRRSKRAAQNTLELREATTWAVEQQRREKERLWLSEAARAVSLGGTISPFVAARASTDGGYAVLLGRLKALCSALLATPEDANIRRLRCNNQNLVEDYGHCCISACPGNGVCRVVQEAGEISWCAMGYVPRYTNKSSWPVPVLLRTGDLRDARLPCGELISSHGFSVVGFEDYSERFFELREPDPGSQPDEWMRWFSTIEKTAELLNKIA